MAIRTELSEAELAEVAEAWGLGNLASARGLPEGSINTLYRLETASGHYVLRLSEGRAEPEIQFETALVAHLQASRYPAVVLVPRADGRPYGVVKQRFACVFQLAAGEHVDPRRMTTAQALDSGRLLGRLHVVTESFPGRLQNRYGPPAIRAMVSSILARPAETMGADLRDARPLLEREAARLDLLPAADEGVLHADWFPDNLLFLGDRLATVLDFEMACRGPYVLDLATAVHAGCYDDGYVPARARSLVAGYLEERRLSQAEKAALFPWACFCALRFTATRVLDFHLDPLGGDKLLKKDWRRFRDRLTATLAMGEKGFADLCGL